MNLSESPARNAFERSFSKVLSRKQDWGNVLDVGCSTRFYESWISCTKYTGFDTPGNAHADVTGDAHKLPFKDGEFDTVIAVQLFYTLEDPQKALSEMKRVLKPGGTLIATFLHQSPEVGPEGETKNLFTPYRVKKMFSDWKSVKLTPLKGILTQVGQNWFRWSSRQSGLVRALLFPLRWKANLLTLIDTPNLVYAVNFLVMAKK